MSAICTAVPASQALETCDACGRTDCPDMHLCDVRWENYQPVEAGDVATALHEISAAWGVRFEVDAEKAADLAMALSERQTNHWQARPEALALLRDGHSFEEVARAVQVPVATIVEKFTRLRSAPLAVILRAESLLRAGELSQRAIAADCGISEDVIHRLANRLGLGRSKKEPTLGAVGMVKYGDDIVERAYELRESGMTCRQVQRELGFDDDPKAQIVYGLLRRPRPSLSAPRVLETVAS